MKKNGKKIYLINVLFYLFLLIPLFKPICLTIVYPKINTLFNYYLVVSSSIILLIYILNCKVNKNTLYMIMFFMILLLSTYMNNGNIYGCFLCAIKSLSISFLIDYGLSKNGKSLLIAFEILFSLLIYINFISLIIYPDGMYVSSISGYAHNWFLGFKNIHILYILPAILMSYINCYMDKKNCSIRTIILLIVSIISIIKVWSATGIVGISLALIYILFNKKIISIKLFNLKNYLIGVISIFMCVVVFRVQNIFRYLIVDILKKDLTFTGRTYIWDYVIKYIQKRPIIGYGMEYSDIRFNKGINFHSYHAHNIILEIIYKTGIIGLLLIIFVVKDVIKRLNEYKTEKISKILSFWILIYMIITLTEAYDLELILFIFTLASNVKCLILNKEREEVEN